MGLVNSLAGLFKRRKRDDIGFVSDPGRRAEDWTVAEIEAEFARQVDLGWPVGLYLDGDWSWMTGVLDGVEKVKRPVVVQVNTGPPASFRGPFKVDGNLLRLAGEGKIKLFFHLPHLFDIWLPFDNSQIRWEGELVRVPMIRVYVQYLNDFVANLPEDLNLDLGFVLHAGYPRWPGKLGPSDKPGKAGGGYVPAGESVKEEARELGNRFRNNLVWLFDPFLGGLSRRGVRGRILVENLVGLDKHPVHMATFKNCGMLTSGLDGSRYGRCWDLLHSWASGEDLSPVDLEGTDVGLIHMNGGPANVRFGSRKDLHGYTELRTAVKRGAAYPWLGDPAFGAIPMVFERKLYSVMLKDSAWVAEMWGLA